MTNELTETHQTHQSRSSRHHQNPVDAETLESHQQDWNRYLYQSPSTPYPVPQVDQCRLALTEYMYRQELDGRHLFHLTLTYKPYADRIYKEQDINNFYINFHVRHFLPRLLDTRNIHTNAKKKIQPICYAFLEEHEPQSVAVSHDVFTEYVFPVRLHHHAILAVHDQTLNRMQNLVGTNTFANSHYSHKIMTSHLRPCEPKTLLYASKMMWKYPDFLLFPDRLHRTHHKYSYQ